MGADARRPVRVQALARGLALRGEFTRAIPGESFYPEWLRSPGYPFALAPLCRVSCDHRTIAVAQAAGAAFVVLLTFQLARPLLSRRAALIAAFATAGTPALAYFAALPLAELLTTLLLCLTLALLATARADGRVRWAVVCGAAAGALALTRPLFLPSRSSPRSSSSRAVARRSRSSPRPRW